MGSKSAFTDSMEKHVVGSEGRWHILHLPKGPSMLEVSARSYSGDRRHSLSTLKRLESGTVLSEGFPPYVVSSSYKNPLDAAGQAKEKAAVDTINDDSAMDYLKKLVAFPTRSYSNPDASAKVEKFLKTELEDLGMHTCYHTFNTYQQNSLTNVVAHVPGSQSGAVIVGAHYDSRPFEGAAPGAEDNGSGVASLLAMAKAFVASKVQPKKSVYFVAFAGEEPGLIGSKHFAEDLKNQKLPSDCTAASSFLQRNLKGEKKEFKASDYSAIVMDEIGWLTPNKAFPKPTVNLESTDAQGKEVMDHLRDSAKTHLGEKIAVVHNGHPFGSDHMSFLDNGIASVLTINGDDEAYPNYHQSSDKIENVNPNLMKMITQMNLGALMRMSM